MVATLTLLAIMVGVSMPILTLLLESYSTAQGMAPITSESTLAMERMVRELRLAKCSSLQFASRSLTCSTNTGETLRLHQSQPGDTTLYLVKNGTERALAYSIAAESLSFALLAPGLVEISFRLHTPWSDGTLQEPLWTTAVYTAP